MSKNGFDEDVLSGDRLRQLIASKRKRRIADDAVEDYTREKKRGFTEDGQRFTPFNMDQERRFGVIENDEFVFKKNAYEDNFTERDNWLDGIQDNTEFLEDDDDENDDDEDEPQIEEEQPIASVEEKVDVYKKIMEYLEENETVTKAIKRLGGGNRQARRSVGTKKQTKLAEEFSESEKELHQSNMKKMEELTELADRVVIEFSHFDVYSQTKREINNFVKTKLESRNSNK